MLHAAVIVPVVLYRAPTVLFVRRAAHLRRNAGEIAFPGGLAEDVDANDLERTARREFEEETGIAARLLTVVGQLASAVVINRSVEIAPFVALLRGPLEPKVDRNEVDAAFTIALATIAQPGALHQGIEHADGRDIPTWVFDDGSVHVWGATARILASFLAAMRGDDPALARALDAYGVRIEQDPGGV
jgi:8-oxo-dGTP pyrophosphatase MutT (NUDIX family)